MDYLNMNVQNAAQNLTVCNKQHNLNCGIVTNTPVVNAPVAQVNIATVEIGGADGRAKLSMPVGGGFPAITPPELSGAGPRNHMNPSDTSSPIPSPEMSNSMPQNVVPQSCRGDEMLNACVKQHPLCGMDTVFIPGQTDVGFDGV